MKKNSFFDDMFLNDDIRRGNIELSQVLSVGNENSFIKSDPSTYVLFTNPFSYLLCPFLYLPFVCLQPY